MNRFKNILLVFNPEVNVRTAMDQTASLAVENSAQVTVCVVIKELPSNLSMALFAISPQKLLASLTKEYQEQVDGVVSALKKRGVAATAQVKVGVPFIEIIRQVLRDEHDLVIITAEGKSGLTQRLFGSTSMRLMRKCPCPVWVIKPSRRKKYGNILAAVDTTTDYSEPEQDSLNSLIMQLSGSIAKINNSQLHVVQVWNVYGEGYMSVRGGLSEQSIKRLRTTAKKQYGEQVDKLVDDADLGDITVYKYLPRSENIAKTIVSLTRTKKIDLLVMGTVCRTGVAGLIIGNTAEKVLNKVDCSVLTVKPEGFISPVKLEDT